VKTYVITLAKVFPKEHIRAGEDTNFKELFLAGSKIHTIRLNYELWKKRFEEIEIGNACISIRQWSGKPYKSKQEVIKVLAKDDGIGIEHVKVYKYMSKSISSMLINSKSLFVIQEICLNDGLDYDNFNDWFKPVKSKTHLALIHFTNFRYVV